MSDEFDFRGPGALPAQPTSALPGTPEKIALLAERVARREQLFHPLDAKIDLGVSPLEALAFRNRRRRRVRDPGFDAEPAA
jgi:hypothetical protein